MQFNKGENVQNLITINEERRNGTRGEGNKQASNQASKQPSKTRYWKTSTNDRWRPENWTRDEELYVMDNNYARQKGEKESKRFLHTLELHVETQRI